MTAAINGFAGRPVKPSQKSARSGFAGVPDRKSAVFLDLVGYNYKLGDYEVDRQLFPKRIYFGAESYPRDVAAIWDLTEKTPWLIGDFVWTAMDYLGEAGLGGSVVLPASSDGDWSAMRPTWPWVNAFCGDIDLTGQQKAPSLARDVVWGLSPVEIVVQRPVPEGKVERARQWGWPDEQQSWTWPGHEGKAITVRIYSVGDRVELRLNGRTLDSKPVTAADQKRIEFTVNYAPGVLEAVVFRTGTQIARKQLTTTGVPTSVRLQAERSKVGRGRSDISHVRVEIIDAGDRVVPDASRNIQLFISGPAELIAFGSATPFAIGSFRSPSAQAWNGRALAILRGQGRAGRVTIEARSDGLRSGSTTVFLT